MLKFFRTRRRRQQTPEQNHYKELVASLPKSGHQRIKFCLMTVAQCAVVSLEAYYELMPERVNGENYPFLAGEPAAKTAFVELVALQYAEALELRSLTPESVDVKQHGLTLVMGERTEVVSFGFRHKGKELTMDMRKYALKNFRITAKDAWVHYQLAPEDGMPLVAVTQLPADTFATER